MQLLHIDIKISGRTANLQITSWCNDSVGRRDVGELAENLDPHDTNGIGVECCEPQIFGGGTCPGGCATAVSVDNSTGFHVLLTPGYGDAASYFVEPTDWGNLDEGRISETRCGSAALPLLGRRHVARAVSGSCEMTPQLGWRHWSGELKISCASRMSGCRVTAIRLHYRVVGETPHSGARSSLTGRHRSTSNAPSTVLRGHPNWVANRDAEEDKCPLAFRPSHRRRALTPAATRRSAAMAGGRAHCGSARRPFDSSRAESLGGWCVTPARPYPGRAVIEARRGVHERRPAVSSRTWPGPEWSGGRRRRHFGP
ncbi:hypothetical protein LAUMK136_04077 [Mycobacterium attenuatum]|uniref:Uncharacterized protein n=1 Tax=Mycobacterium attenuatum TaxID=2341086 RepID=A0A498Q9T8_9MYCO|nr:hypothetical protein LAUMK136_04077 [Mycobacterium attenuatum]